jgi:hypothetical protein
MAVGGINGKNLCVLEFRMIGDSKWNYRREFDLEFVSDFYGALAFFVQSRLDLEEANQTVRDRKSESTGSE